MSSKLSGYLHQCQHHVAFGASSPLSIFPFRVVAGSWPGLVGFFIWTFKGEIRQFFGLYEWWSAMLVSFCGVRQVIVEEMDV